MFLFLGRMEKKKLERARQDKLETTIDTVQAAQLKIILGRLLSTDSTFAHSSSPWPLPGAELGKASGTPIFPLSVWQQPVG